MTGDIALETVICDKLIIGFWLWLITVIFYLGIVKIYKKYKGDWDGE